MNILYICDQVGSPEMGMVFRPYYFAREFNKLGHSTIILGSSFVHNRKQNPKITKDFEESTIDGIRYIWIKTCTYKKAFKRLKNIFSFAIKVRIHAKYIAQKYRPDVVISACAHNLDIYASIKIAKYASAKLVYEVRDLWPLSPMEIGGYTKYNPFIMLVQHAEDTAYKKADAVVSVLPCVHEYMQSRGLDLKKLTIIPNGIAEDDWTDISAGESLDKNLCNFIEKNQKQGKMIVGYTGAYATTNALAFLLDAAKVVQNTNIIFILIGSGLEKERLIEKKEKLRLQNVYFFDPIPKSSIPRLLSYFDILYIGLQNHSLFRFGISPNKMMDYMMAAKPIVNAIKAGNDPISEAGCGITVEPENPQAIADGIMKLAKLTDWERQAMGKKGREYILKNNVYSVLVQKFLAAINKISI
ncbi:glycosyltransferase family 4 protein [Treponema phagedenis]|uniref:glycosyltransferase family 4 protein n=1 Tax=Treponema phagedenis TaxID=162 RepID=UPI0011E76BB5|nr:glycosyltransferase family 4 protein [Treponema phagedenis]QEK01274.1 glycosyltransferase family 4 protein [Treponema phagedenis]QSH93523.1 glycosyltransferase WbuB [Treponema phagedenis]